MCGIVGAVAQRNIAKILVDGLKPLEYRGYDSAGVAVISPDQKLLRIRTIKKVRELEQHLLQSPLLGNTGIAHTRWATHGEPSERNAHPIFSHNEIAVVHNGIIENQAELRHKLVHENYQFTSDTDTEVVAHLLHYHAQKTPDFLAAVQATIAELEGAFALGIISARHPERLFAVGHGAPLVIGNGANEHFIASDTSALSPLSPQYIILEEADIADITANSLKIYDKRGREVKRAWHALEQKHHTTDKGGYNHFMAKEIAEQARVMTDGFAGRLQLNKLANNVFGFTANKIFSKIKHVHIVACGTSYHAALVARYWLEALAGIACSVDIASEYRYRHPVVPKNSLLVCISQSGETADTLAALRMAKQLSYVATLAICNVPESTLAREVDLLFMTRAGMEIGVASTKAFTTQLTALLMLVIAIGAQQGFLSYSEPVLVKLLQKLPEQVTAALSLSDQIAKLATKFADKQHALFLGRGTLFPIALEGALKLKEISYIHAEGYPAGELKHGPLALVDKNMPVITIAPHGDLLEKLISNMQEVRARGGELIVFTDSTRHLTEPFPQISLLEMPVVDPIVAPIVYTIPLQLLAYHVAVLKGADVDQPRNLAKSVTVE